MTRAGEKLYRQPDDVSGWAIMRAVAGRVAGRVAVGLVIILFVVALVGG